MILLRDCRKIVVSLLPLLALGLMLLISAPSWAQVAGATLLGTVTDASGAVVPQAQVLIKNVATGISTTAPTNADGLYSAPNLLPGDYEVTVSASGFRTEVRSGINLTVGAQQVLNVALQVGQTNQQIQVKGAAPTVELASSAVSAVVGSQTVVDLPLNGRDWTLLAALQPGVSAVTTQRPNDASGPKGNRGYGQEMSISGTRPQLNNYRLDGISIVDYAGGSPGSALGVALGVDAVEEFSVSTSNQSAEYGRTSGGVINAITRSGTNQFHGDAYWFLRDEGLDARNFFDANLPPFHRNQFGASAGGPIQKDKTFFFADYEGLRESLSAANVDIVPSADARNGIVHITNPDGSTTACTIGVPSPGCGLNNSKGTVGVDPLVQPFLGLYPLPNAGLIAPGDTGFFNVETNQISRGNFVTARIDRKISEKDSAFGTWFWDKGVGSAPDPLEDVVVGNKSTRVMVALQESHTFSPSLVNSVRGGYSRVATFVSGNIQALNPLVTDVALASEPGVPGLAVFSVPGITGFVGGGVGAFTANNFHWNSFQAYDDAFLSKGVHSIKAGFAFERMQVNILFPANPTGAFGFGSLNDFLTNVPANFVGGLPGSLSPRGMRQSLFGGYVQDDWRARPNLTLNLGLRYEAVTVPTEVQNKLATLPTFTSPLPGHLGSPYFQNPTKRNFEPRVGFSWDPFSSGKTAVRGAFGIFDALPLNYEFNQAQVQSAPFVEQFSAANLSQGSFPFGAAAAGSTGLQLTSSSIEQNPHRNYVMIWNLNVQRQLNASTTAMLGYVGNHGVHMLDRQDDANSVLPISMSHGVLFPSPPGSGTVLNPNVGGLIAEYWGGDSEYDALEAQVTKRMSHGFQVQGSYTWGKNIDTGSASVLGDPFTNSISSLFFFCKKCRRGLSDYDIAQTLVVNYLWDVPTPKNWGGVGSQVLGGWELGGILTAETGVPITPTIGGDPLGLNSTDPWAFPDRLTGPGCSNPVNPGNPDNYIKLNCFGLPQASPAIAALCTPFVPGGPPNPPAVGTCSNLMGNAGRNTVIGPGLVTFDFSLFKNNYIRRISETFNAQFRAEFFNIFNRANFETPFDNEALFDQTGSPIGGAGSVARTSTPAREIQLALKLIW